MSQERDFTNPYTLEETEEIMSKVGIALKDEDGNFRSMYDILTDISKAFNNVE
jgi:hypothetical protein